MYKLLISTKFKKDLKKIKKHPKDEAITRSVLKVLQEKGVAGIADSMRPHRLSGEYKNNPERRNPCIDRYRDIKPSMRD